MKRAMKAERDRSPRIHAQDMTDTSIPDTIPPGSPHTDYTMDTDANALLHDIPQHSAKYLTRPNLPLAWLREGAGDVPSPLTTARSKGPCTMRDLGRTRTILQEHLGISRCAKAAIATIDMTEEISAIALAARDAPPPDVLKRSTPRDDMLLRRPKRGEKRANSRDDSLVLRGLGESHSSPKGLFSGCN